MADLFDIQKRGTSEFFTKIQTISLQPQQVRIISSSLLRLFFLDVVVVGFFFLRFFSFYHHGQK